MNRDKLCPAATDFVLSTENSQAWLYAKQQPQLGAPLWFSAREVLGARFLRELSDGKAAREVTVLQHPDLLSASLSDEQPRRCCQVRSDWFLAHVNHATTPWTIPWAHLPPVSCRTGELSMPGHIESWSITLLLRDENGQATWVEHLLG